jgi:hypothetical protein
MKRWLTFNVINWSLCAFGIICLWTLPRPFGLILWGCFYYSDACVPCYLRKDQHQKQKVNKNERNQAYYTNG